MNALSGVSDPTRRNALLALIPFSVAVGLAVAHSASPVVIGAALGIIPAILLQAAVVRNLFIGIVVFLIVEYLQPGFRIPALAVVRPALVVAGSLLLGWILNAMQHRVKLVANWQVKSYIVFFVMSAASAFGAISVGMVGQTLITMAKSLAVFFVVYSIVNTVDKLRRLIWTYVVLHLILAALALPLFFTTGDRNFGDLGGGFLGDENDSAMALVIMIPYAYFMISETKSKLFRVILALGSLASSASVLFSFSRGAFVGFCTMVGYVWSKSTRKGAAAAALVVMLGVLFVAMPAEYWDRIESVKDYNTEGSAQGRIDAWRGGLRMLAASPLTGAGLGNFNRTYGSRYNTISTRWTAAHSLYVQFIGELGVPGVIFLVTTIILTFRGFRRVRHGCRNDDDPDRRSLLTIARAGECGFATYLVTTAFLNSMAYPHLWHFGAISGCAVLALEDLDRRRAAQAEEAPAPIAVVGAQETTATG